MRQEENPGAPVRRTPGFHVHFGIAVPTSPPWFAAATAATTTIATATSAATTEVTTTDWLRSRLVHDQRAAIELVLMQFVDRLLCVVIGGHFHERKPARAASCLIAHDTDVVDGSRTAEQLREFFVGALIREVAHVQSAAHRCETLSRASLTRTVTCRRASD
jgi:hypothetical protein